MYNIKQNYKINIGNESDRKKRWWIETIFFSGEDLFISFELSTISPLTYSTCCLSFERFFLFLDGLSFQFVSCLHTFEHWTQDITVFQLLIFYCWRFRCRCRDELTIYGVRCKNSSFYRIQWPKKQWTQQKKRLHTHDTVQWKLKCFDIFSLTITSLSLIHVNVTAAAAATTKTTKEKIHKESK